MQRFAFVLLLVIGLAHAEERPRRKLDLHIVPTPIKSYRLLAMSMDDDGFIWAGSIHKIVHRYDPRTGMVQDVPMPFPATASACICVGKKVYILGQTYPKLIVYDRSTKKFSEMAYPSPKPNVWYGTAAGDGRHLYLLDRGSTGVIRWDTQTDAGKVIPWPYKAPLPSSGRFEPGDSAIWCNVWEAGGKYRPYGIARLDTEKYEFKGFFPFPDDDAGLKPYTDPATTLFLPYTLKGKLVPFDSAIDRPSRLADRYAGSVAGGDAAQAAPHAAFSYCGGTGVSGCLLARYPRFHRSEGSLANPASGNRHAPG